MTDEITRRHAVEVVAFDLMDTLLHDPYLAALQAAFGDRLRAAFAGRDKTTWPRFERGEITEDEFWSAHADWEPDVDAFDRVRREHTTWLPGMRDVVADVRAAGCRVVIASNYPSWIVDLERRFLDGLVDAVVASWRVGARKPDPAFYAAVVDAAEARPEAIAFVDDREANVEGARDAGMHGVVFTDADQVARDLAVLGALTA